MPNASLTESTATTNTFQFTLRGYIESVEGVLYLVSRDNIRFRVKEVPSEFPQGMASWQVIPSTDSTGILQNLSVESYSTDDTNGAIEDECQLLGRVVQLGKKSQFVQLKISRPGKKTLKLSFLSPDLRMKIGQLWQVVAIRRGEALHIHFGQPVEQNNQSAQKQPITPQNNTVTELQTASNPTAPTSFLEAFPHPTAPTNSLETVANSTVPTSFLEAVPNPTAPTSSLEAVPNPTAPTISLEAVPNPTAPTSVSPSDSSTPTQNNNTKSEASLPPAQNGNSSTGNAQSNGSSKAVSPPIEVAITALVEHTQTDNWELRSLKQRNRTWEWEAFSHTSQRQARVKVVGNGRKVDVYEYPFIPDSPEALVDQEQIDRLVVTPLGAAMGIGASCFQILIGPYEIVLDCGTRPKGYDPLPALDYVENPNLLLISHGHQDHIGAVPVFHSRWPAVRMICTPGTREIAHVMLQDCLKVQQMNEDSPQLFDETDLDRTLFRLETQPIGADFEPLPGLTVRFINAGHILGAACVYLRYRERSLLYTGDYNTTSSRTTTGLRLADLPTADILITESTYGADVHPARKTQETALLEAIAEVIQSGGNVLIPAFALGRAQEILLSIRTSALFHKLKIPVYVDGLVRAVTDVFRDNLDLLPSSVQNLVRQNGIEPFCDQEGTPPIIAIGSPRERPLAIAKPSVIVASSGMLTGGPSVYYASVLLERDNAAIFISGYTDEESPGRLLQNLKTGDTIELDGKEITVKAQIRRFNLSAHADKVGLGQVINKVSPKHLVLIHGGTNALHELAKSGDLRSKHYIHIPSVGERVEYGQAPEHISAMQVAKLELPAEFEVEIEAEVEGAWLRIPESVVENDPRWQLLASSGILKARWDGIQLKLSAVTQQNVVVQKAIENAIASKENCCAVCQFFKAGSCECEDSALFELKVDPLGKCTEFTERLSAQENC